MTDQPTLRRRLRTFVLSFGGNLLAVPLYWQELMPLLQVVIPYPNAALLCGAIGGFAVAALIASSWVRSARLGAVAQIAALLPSVVRLVRSYEGRQRVPKWMDVSDLRFVLAFLLLCVVPAVLVAVSVLALRRHARRGVK